MTDGRPVSTIGSAAAAAASAPSPGLRRGDRAAAPADANGVGPKARHASDGTHRAGVDSDGHAAGVRADRPDDALRWTPPDLSQRPAKALRPPTAAELLALEDEARAAGFEAGFREGREAGFESAMRETRARAERLLRADRERLSQLAEVWRDQWPDTVAAMEDALLRLVDGVARKVVGAELELKPERIREWVHAALDQVPDDASEVTLTLHPQDALLMLGRPLESGASVAWRERIKVQGDATLARGDVVVEGPATRIDHRVQARMAAVIDALWAGLRHGNTEGGPTSSGAFNAVPGATADQTSHDTSRDTSSGTETGDGP